MDDKATRTFASLRFEHVSHGFQAQSMELAKVFQYHCAAYDHMQVSKNSALKELTLNNLDRHLSSRSFPCAAP